MHTTYQSRIKVSYNETDQMGYVHHNNYVNYYESARWEMFDSIGIPYKMIEERGFMLPVVKVSINYLKPAFYDDELLIETKIRELRGARLQFDCRIFNGLKELINVAEISLAFIKKESRKVCHPPAFVCDRIKETGCFI